MTHPLPEATPQHVAELAPFGPRPVTTQVLHKNRGGSATVLAISQGEGLREHVNPDDALVLVVEGEARATVGGVPQTVRAGETIRFPATVPHAVEAVTDMRMVLILLHASP